MYKQIWDITLDDLIKNPVWYFPMIEEGDFDEATVSPANSAIANDSNIQVLVLSDFVDSKNKKYQGYVFFGDSNIEVSQPCMFIDDEAIVFWFGIVKPDGSKLKKLSFPIIATSRTVFGLESITVEINNYGYLDDEFKRHWVDN
jgi:hypothetical protein